MVALRIGCARVSTEGQHLIAQRQALATLGVQPFRIRVDQGNTTSAVPSTIPPARPARCC